MCLANKIGLQQSAAHTSNWSSFAGEMVPLDGCELVLRRMRELASGEYEPLALAHGNVDFQIARGGSVSL